MIRIFRYIILIIPVSLYSLNSAFAQTGNKYDFERIEDNSFLLEEAYNQEAGVIQHISSFQYMKGHIWQYTFTDEWPVPREKHQLSVTIPVLNNGATGIGDLLINYRYQAVLRNQLAFSPRFSLVLPSGNWRKGLGTGVPGYQFDLPVSYLISTRLVTHYNLGVTLIPNAKNADNSRSDQMIYNYGLSIILLVNKNFNFMLEAAGYTTSTKMSGSNTTTSGSLFISPGFRYAINFKSGLQIVPGFAVPVGLGSSQGSSGVFGYLSFEHPLWKP